MRKLCSFVLFGLMAAAAAAHAQTPRLKVAALPIVFESNRGQARDDVLFLARGRGYRLDIRRDGTHMTLGADGASTLAMRLAGSNLRARVESREPLAGYSNYLIGPRAAHITAVPHARQVMAREVYAGIDLVYYGNDGQLEYDFVVSPRADPSRIALRFSGADALEISPEGDLVFRWRDREVRHRKPVLYQQPGKRPVDGRYTIARDGSVRIVVGAYDRDKTLVIDPVLSLSSYLGGTGSDSINGLTLDASGNIYVVGTTASTNFPTRSPRQAANAGGSDVFVTKIDASGGSIIYSTYLGGGGADTGRGIAVDATGSAYVAGETASSNFPVSGSATTSCGNGDAFVTKLSPTGGALTYSLCVGGSGVDGAMGIAIDAATNAYVVGVTRGGLPVVNAAQPTIGGFGTTPDAFVGRLKADGSAWEYLTYLGGDAAEIGRGISATAAGDVCVTGQTESVASFPTLGPLQPAAGRGVSLLDGFAAKYTAAGGRVFATYLGGDGADAGYATAMDTDGSCVVTGWTESSNFPLVAPVETEYRLRRDAFATKYNPVGSGYVFSTYLGGGQRDAGYAVSISLNGVVAIGGESASSNLRVLNQVQPGHSDPGVVLSSDDGGQTFLPRLELPEASINALVAGPGTTLFAGTSNGVYRSSDNGVTWERKPTPFPMVLALAIDLNPCTLYAGLDSERFDFINSPGVLAVSSDCGETWGPNALGFAGRTVRSLALSGGPVKLPIAGVTRSTSTVPVSVPEYVVARVTSGGFTESVPNLDRAVGDYTVATDPANPCTSYGGDEQGHVFRNTSCTSWNWTQLGSSIGAPVRTLAAHPIDQQTIVAGTSTGAIHLGPQPALGFLDWRRVATLDGAVTSIIFRPDNPHIAFAATEAGSVYLSSNGGQTWTRRSLTSGPVMTSLAFPPSSPTILLVGAANSGDGFVTRLSSVGNLIDATLVGGRGSDAVRGISAAVENNTVLVGTTTASDFPVTSGALQPSPRGGSDGFLARIDATQTPLAPGAPRNLMADLQGGTLTLTWQPPRTGAVVTEYVIQASPSESFDPLVGNITTGSTLTTFVMTNYPPAVYYFRVVALSGFILGGPSNVQRVGDSGAPPGVPTLVASQVASNPVTLTWSPGFGPAPTNYTIIAGYTSGTSDLVAAPLGLVTTITANAPTGREIFVRVVAGNSSGETESNEISFVVSPGPPPDPPTLAPATVAPNRQVTLTWSPAITGGAADSFTVIARDSPSGAPIAVLPGLGGTTFSIVAPPGTYYVTMVAINGGGTSGESNQIAVAVP